MTRYPADALRAYAFALLTRAGLAEERARVVAEILVEGGLLGHDTHGLALLAPYLGEIERGAMASRGDLVVVNERPAALLRHVLWTRLLNERRTTDPHNEIIDLIDYVRKNKDILVIKPNRSYGGDRILIGPSVTDGEWADAIELSLREPGGWVVQRLAKISVYEFPVIGDDGSVQAAPFYVVIGLASTKYGVAVLGRASQKQVVNVSQGRLAGVVDW